MHHPEVYNVKYARTITSFEYNTDQTEHGLVNYKHHKKVVNFEWHAYTIYCLKSKQK